MDRAVAGLEASRSAVLKLLIMHDVMKKAFTKNDGCRVSIQQSYQVSIRNLSTFNGNTLICVTFQLIAFSIAINIAQEQNAFIDSFQKPKVSIAFE